MLRASGRRRSSWAPIKSIAFDARKEFVDEYVVRAIKADALYEGQYPLATALGRPLMAKWLCDTAHKEGANAVAHGCTGKGNDQVRFDVGVFALGPELKIIGPARDWGMTRERDPGICQQAQDTRPCKEGQALLHR